jgi:tRNA threonylcarbamoyl adenosine modification protein YeaZ
MLLLAMDTSSSVVAAALHDGGSVVASDSASGAQAHGELLAPVVQRVLASAGVTPGELTHVGVGVGPGPFTGLRVGIVTARVMADALGIPVHGVCSLDVLAHAAGVPGTSYAVATDARRREVYWRRYGSGGEPIGEPGVARAADMPPEVLAGPVVGPGPLLYPEEFADPRPPVELDPAALADLLALRIRSGAGLLEPEPLYLRRPDAVESAARKRVTQP